MISSISLLEEMYFKNTSKWRHSSLYKIQYWQYHHKMSIPTGKFVQYWIGWIILDQKRCHLVNVPLWMRGRLDFRVLTRTGEEFQCDALCQEGHFYQHYSWNDPDPRKYFSATNYYHYMPVWCGCLIHFMIVIIKLVQYEQPHPMKVLCHGVVRKRGSEK